MNWNSQHVKGSSGFWHLEMPSIFVRLQMFFSREIRLASGTTDSPATYLLIFLMLGISFAGSCCCLLML